jgi:hypothetical protein
MHQNKKEDPGRFKRRSPQQIECIKTKKEDPGTSTRRCPHAIDEEAMYGVNGMDYTPIASGGHIARFLRPAGEYGDRLTTSGDPVLPTPPAAMRSDRECHAHAHGSVLTKKNNNHGRSKRGSPQQKEGNVRVQRDGLPRILRPASEDGDRLTYSARHSHSHSPPTRLPLASPSPSRKSRANRTWAVAVCTSK